MNILVSTDENYADALQVMLKSLFVNNPGMDITVYLLHDGLRKEILQELAEFVCLHQALLIDIKVEYELDRFILPTNTYLSVNAYYRCLAAELLPPSVERILYLDVDTIILKSLAPLYQSDFEDHFLIAPDDYYDIPSRKINFDIPMEKTYFCSGIMLMNVNKFRADFDINRLFQWLEKYQDKIGSCDQDAFNGLLFDSVKIIESAIWNYFTWRPSETYFFYFRNRKKILKNIAIVHCGGRVKPWHVGCINRFGGVWWQYAKQTKWRKRRYIQQYNLIKLVLVFCFVIGPKEVAIKLYQLLKRSNPQLAGSLKNVLKGRK